MYEKKRMIIGKDEHVACARDLISMEKINVFFFGNAPLI